ncbi:PREDICTED: acyl-CoA synthetase family member 3, mitochondrial [Papilio polytes]|uniref:acyl-CoA synthetase family member 3, mitochondrial n=1 Tax=Papilio polytes TaxID=76194 RepID=UPI0006769FD8|nr:PREDICTED: acyl-CoA synthetase family member 3, mitochondrial [Papilio polytes]XP_013137979.1 PREDICTED: acyl-CoA synthetase family member 3, mitochondrial [Papilio polytes]
MEYSFRSIRILNRLLRKPVSIANYKYTSTAPVKEELNSELLTSFNQDIKAGGVVPVFRRALLFPSRIALQDDIGIYTYAGLHQAASVLSDEISAQLLGETQRTIAYMCSNNASHVITQWAIWMTGNIAIPLSSIHPPDMLKYFLTDSTASLVICTQEYEKLLRPITLEVSTPLLIAGREKEVTAQLYQPNTTFMKPKMEETLSDVGRSNFWYGQNDAMLIYTSGTTSKPKGVVWTHNMLSTQIAALQSAWQYSANDVVLHTLPLHHIHGQLNSLNASLAAGARIRMLSSFVSHAVWSRLLGMGEREEAKVSVFHGVPAMYSRLVADYDTMFADSKMAEYVRSTLSSKMRLMCAGSAPLPDKLFRKWEEISGIRLLERYGMSEVGMALSNPYRPVEQREVGCVGAPLPGVAARIATVDELKPLITVESPVPDNQIYLDKLGLSGSKEFFTDNEGNDWKQPTVTVHEKSQDNEYQGELLLKGPAVFTRYWNRLPQLNASDFTKDGWFRTGDTALYSSGRFKILGRTSVDIIKTSGYKVSALQVESAVLEHPNVVDVAVLGVQHDTYGEIITAVVVSKDNAKLTLKDIKDVAGKKLPPYSLPRKLLLVEVMPRNAMGKLDKKEIRKVFADKLNVADK